MQEVGGSIPPGSTNLRRFASYGWQAALPEAAPPGGFLFSASRLHDGGKTGGNACKARSRSRNTSPSKRRSAIRRCSARMCGRNLRHAPARHPGHAAARDGQARHRDDDPVAQRAGGAGDPRRQARDRGGARGQRRAGRECAQAPRPLRRLSPRCRCRIRMRRPPSLRAASRSSALSARWSTASRKPARPTTFSITILPQYRPFWRAVEALDVPFYLHPRNPLPSWTENLRRPPLAARTELGVLGGDFGARAAADRQRAVRRMPAARRSCSAISARASRCSSGASTAATAG